MIEKIVKAIEMQYLLNRIVHSSSDCYNFVVEEYIEILKKIDEDSMILYHFCTETGRTKNQMWTRIVSPTRELRQVYYDIIESEFKEEGKLCGWEYNTVIEYEEKIFVLKDGEATKLYEILLKEHEMEFEHKYKQVREQIELEKIKKEFE